MVKAMQPSFGLRVKAIREEKGWTQTLLAQNMRNTGITPITATYLEKVEKGQVEPSFHFARRLAKALGASLDFLLGTSEYPAPPPAGPPTAEPLATFICGRKKAPCYRCQASSTKLCDGPGKTLGTTCDRPMCLRCARPAGPNRDLCATHAPSETNPTMPIPPGRRRVPT